MRVLVVIERSPKQRFLVKLHTEELVNEIKELINKKRHSKAIVTALSKGRFEREVGWEELPHLDAELILSEDSARWDLPSK